jgi:hypothetical protein
LAFGAMRGSPGGAFHLALLYSVVPPGNECRRDALIAAMQPAFLILHRKLATGLNADYIPNMVGTGNH